MGNFFCWDEEKQFISFFDANYLIYNTVNKMKINLLVKSNLWLMGEWIIWIIVIKSRSGFPNIQHMLSK